MKYFYLSLFITFSLLLHSCEEKPDKASEKVVAMEEQPNNETLEIKEELTKPEEDSLTLEHDPRKIGPKKPKEQYEIEANIYKINASENPLYGYWVGTFGKNKINIALAHVEGDSIFGHSVCAGNFRPIKGTYKEGLPGVYTATMKEPGDDQYDGEFDFKIDTYTKELKGTWKPYKNTVSAKEYTLKKRRYTYNVKAGKYGASKHYLAPDEVANLLPEQIEMIRNEIYARHGYSFKNLKIRRVFDAQDWYMPMSVDIRDKLTDLEARNIDMLYNYEDYYDEYYDVYGR